MKYESVERIEGALQEGSVTGQVTQDGYHVHLLLDLTVSPKTLSDHLLDYG